MVLPTRMAVAVHVLMMLVLVNAADLMAGERPNIVLVMADDQGWGQVGYNGHPVLETPHLDAMAAVKLNVMHWHLADERHLDPQAA